MMSKYIYSKKEKEFVLTAKMNPRRLFFKYLLTIKRERKFYNLRKA